MKHIDGRDKEYSWLCCVRTKSRLLNRLSQKNCSRIWRNWRHANIYWRLAKLAMKGLLPALCYNNLRVLCGVGYDLSCWLWLIMLMRVTLVHNRGISIKLITRKLAISRNEEIQLSYQLVLFSYMFCLLPTCMIRAWNLIGWHWRRIEHHALLTVGTLTRRSRPFGCHVPFTRSVRTSLAKFPYRLDQRFQLCGEWGNNRVYSLSYRLRSTLSFVLIVGVVSYPQNH